jgi:RNA polymerase sigma-70 factor, ECF subfamily
MWVGCALNVHNLVENAPEGVTVSQVCGDRVLLKRTAIGDREAWLDLRERHALLLFAYLSDVVGDAEEADELMDETFLRAWCEADQFDLLGDLDPTSWLLGLARNVLSAHHPAESRVRSP